MKTFTSYKTPIGNFQTWEDAAVACERVDMDPVSCIDIVVSPTQASWESGPGGWVKLSRPVTVY